MNTRVVRSYGELLHSLVQLRSERRQYHGTFFLRNRAELELMQSLCSEWPAGSKVRISVVACSNGAEVYSILWALRSVRRDLEFGVNGLDISSEILEAAAGGRYSRIMDDLVGSPIFAMLSEREIEAMFDQEGEQLRIKPWIREGVSWQVADALNPLLPECLGQQDIVVANRFLCHMNPCTAERCLRNVARLVRPGGYLFVSGVDLDVRTRVALDLGWEPVSALLEEIHEGDRSLRHDWPWRYWGLEPFTRNRADWRVRYAAVFQLNHSV